MGDIGATLRETRMRARIDVSEIEAKTKIRAKYLRALENEEWDLLPGPAYVRSFLRTYAQALGLDSKALLEEYRREYERPRDGDVAPMGAARRQRERGRPRMSRGYAIAVAALGVLIVLLLVSVLGGGSSSKNNAASTTVKRTTPAVAPAPRPARPRRVALQILPTGPVYVCLIGDGGRKLINQVTLQPGSPQPVYRARHFLITLGNNAVTLKINGRSFTPPASSAAIGYSITVRGRQTLPLGQLPTCQ